MNEEQDTKKEVVATVRKFVGSCDPTPVYEISFMKNVRAGERLDFDPTEMPNIYRHKKKKRS